ncbi:hypothetical protein HanPSC8_Chr05g0203201 [Helianthus annuus]|nr:hypothetical protein HanPSC8_Chr05g0203201 [Helianthus annuus]
MSETVHSDTDLSFAKSIIIPSHFQIGGSSVTKVSCSGAVEFDGIMLTFSWAISAAASLLTSLDVFDFPASSANFWTKAPKLGAEEEDAITKMIDR